jgi:hypothetical protein
MVAWAAYTIDAYALLRPLHFDIADQKLGVIPFCTVDTNPSRRISRTKANSVIQCRILTGNTG